MTPDLMDQGAQRIETRLQKAARATASGGDAGFGRVAVPGEGRVALSVRVKSSTWVLNSSTSRKASMRIAPEPIGVTLKEVDFAAFVFAQDDWNYLPSKYIDRGHIIGQADIDGHSAHITTTRDTLHGMAA